MRSNREINKKVITILGIWFLVLFILLTSMTTFQTIQYIDLKRYNPQIIQELNETNLTGYEEAMRRNVTFNFGSYSQTELFENYRHKFYNVINNITLQVEVDNITVILTTIGKNESYSFTFFKRFTPAQLKINLISSNSTESLQFKLRITKMTNSQDVVKFASEFLKFVISEIFVLVILVNLKTENSFMRNRTTQVVINSFLTVVFLILLI